MWLVVAFILKFIIKLRFPSDVSNIKSYRDKVLKHYDLLDYNTKTEPRGSKISWLPPGIERMPKYN